MNDINLKDLPMDIKLELANAVLKTLMTEEKYKELCEMTKKLERKNLERKKS